MLVQPIEEYLQGAKRVLIAGAGGGFDFLCGLPLALSLESRDCEVHFSNLSFTALSSLQAVRRHGDILWEVDARSHGADYFPEGWLSRWFEQCRSQQKSVWCFAPSGLATYQEQFAFLIQHLQIDTIMVVDGGVDSLLRGDEHSLGTPLWDALTVGAAAAQKVPRKILVSTAFGAERWDKISHAQALHRIADLTRYDAMLGVVTLLKSSVEGRAFIDAAEFIFAGQRNARGSVVVSALLSSLRGEYGERPVSASTEMTPIWVSPLLSLMWFFELDEIVRQKRFLPALEGTRTLADAAEKMQEWVKQQTPAPWEPIPI